MRNTGVGWTYVKKGGSTVREGLVNRERLTSLNRPACKRKGVLWCRELPFCPEPVDHLRQRISRRDQRGEGRSDSHSVVKEEHWIIRSPLRSGVAIRRPSTTWAETGHIASHDEMRTAVRALLLDQDAEGSYRQRANDKIPAGLRDRPGTL